MSNAPNDPFAAVTSPAPAPAPAPADQPEHHPLPADTEEPFNAPPPLEAPAAPFNPFDLPDDIDPASWHESLSGAQVRDAGRNIVAQLVAHYRPIVDDPEAGAMAVRCCYRLAAFGLARQMTADPEEQRDLDERKSVSLATLGALGQAKANAAEAAVSHAARLALTLTVDALMGRVDHLAMNAVNAAVVAFLHDRGITVAA